MKVKRNNLSNVSQEIIYHAQKENHPDFIWLKEARLDMSDRIHPICYGKFSIPARTYTKDPQEYIGCPEAIVCIDSLAYVAWASLIKEKLVDCRISLDEFLNLPLGSMKMRSIDKMVFRKALKKDTDFFGNIKLIDYKPEEITIATAKFDFGNKTFLGKARFSIYNPNYSKEHKNKK